MQRPSLRTRTTLFFALALLVLGLVATGTSSAEQGRLLPVTGQAEVEEPVSENANLDSRMVPPERVLIQKTGDFPDRGNVLVSVELSAADAQAKAQAGKNFITIGQEDAQIILRDDGQGGDATAGDGVFTAIAWVDDAELSERAAEDQEALAGKESNEEFTFSGRSVDQSQVASAFDYSAFAAGSQVELDTAIVALDEEPAAAGSPLQVVSASSPKVSAELTLATPTPSPGVTSQFQDRVLMIRDPQVVQDPNRTWNPCDGSGNPNGVWTFNHLMTEMANQPLTGISPSDFVESWLKTWVQNPGPNVNSFTVSTRAQMQVIIDNWRADSGGGKLDLSKAPLRLLAIVPRLDLRRTTGGGGGYSTNVSGNFLDGGEARFVFGFVLPPHWGGGGGSYDDGDALGFIGSQPIKAHRGCESLPFSVIFEYRIPKCNCLDVRGWARQWVKLANYTPGSSAYNGRLERITRQFVTRNADPTNPNGSALGQLRTNEVALPQDAPIPETVWELREFQLTQMPWSLLDETTTAETPHDSFNGNNPTHFGGSALFGQWVTTDIQNAIQGAGNPEAPVPPVPLFYQGTNYLGPNPHTVDPGYFWNHSLVANTFWPNWARHRASRNACSGCHAGETQTPFVHVDPSSPALPATISGFLSGINNVPDPAFGSPLRHFDDLLRRERDIKKVAKIRCFRFHPIAVPHVLSSLQQTGALPPDLFQGLEVVPPSQQPSLAVDDMKRNPISEVH